MGTVSRKGGKERDTCREYANLRTWGPAALTPYAEGGEEDGKIKGYVEPDIRI
jgi:hypothetical protein